MPRSVLKTVLMPGTIYFTDVALVLSYMLQFCNSLLEVSPQVLKQ